MQYLKPAPLFLQSRCMTRCPPPVDSPLLLTICCNCSPSLWAMNGRRLAASITAMLSERRPMGSNQQAVGWVVLGKGEDQLVMQEGSTWGYSSYVVWDPADGSAQLRCRISWRASATSHSTCSGQTFPWSRRLLKNTSRPHSAPVFDGCTVSTKFRMKVFSTLLARATS